MDTSVPPTTNVESRAEVQSQSVDRAEAAVENAEATTTEMIKLLTRVEHSPVCFSDDSEGSNQIKFSEYSVGTIRPQSPLMRVLAEDRELVEQMAETERVEPATEPAPEANNMAPMFSG